MGIICSTQRTYIKYVGSKYLKWFYDFDWEALGIPIFILILIFVLVAIWHG